MRSSPDGVMFTAASRTDLRDELVRAARDDARIVGAALIGSGALGQEDAWSDIDLALSIESASLVEGVVDDWTRRLYEGHEAVTHLDMRSPQALYRVFLLANTLQVDVSFWPASEFRAIGPAFKLVFGEARPSLPAPTASARTAAEMGWLYALHVRSSVARHRVLQAEFMLSGMRQQVIVLLCLRHNVPAHQARGVDDLPPEYVGALRATIPPELEAGALRSAFDRLMEMLIVEIRHVEDDLGERLEKTLRALASGQR